MAADMAPEKARDADLAFTTKSLEEVENATMVELPPRNPMDWLSYYIGRVAMVLIAMLVLVMSFEVFMRYFINSPTVWANASSFWLSGFIFLLSGLFAMQQRAHIRIFLLYDIMPRNAQRVCDVISTLLIVLFAVALVWGSYSNTFRVASTMQGLGEAWIFSEPTTVWALSLLGFPVSNDRIYFDPPIPATLKPTILIASSLLALQAVVNLVADWSREKEVHSPLIE